MIIWEYIYCVYSNESLVYTQEIFCACTTLLCMLWARNPRGQRPKEAAVQGLGGSLAPGVPGPEHAQECCACTRDFLCIHKRFFSVYTMNVFSYYHIILLHYILHTTYYILHTIYYILHTTYYILHTTYYMLHTT